MQTSVTPEGRFRVGVHKPSSHTVANLREHDHLDTLGCTSEGTEITNSANFPSDVISVEARKVVYEILNPLPFRGCTYIDSGWADARAKDPGLISIEALPAVSLRALLGDHCSPEAARTIIENLPLPLRYELAARSTDAKELVWLARSSCQMILTDNDIPVGLVYTHKNNVPQPLIHDHFLFETLANNPHLPDVYKEIMVLKPGAQGNSEIVGDFLDLSSKERPTEIFEYLRANSYIPGGHYAANCSPKSIRYAIQDLSSQDMSALRHLYYQRIYVTLAERFGLPCPINRRALSQRELEDLRLLLEHHLIDAQDSQTLATLWGWNFGYDISGSAYRLHASHQMIHQQYALVPPWVDDALEGKNLAFSAGDMVAEVISQYHQEYNSDFFDDYLKAICNNVRTDQGSQDASLIVWQDEHALLFVPKAQVSQWELQIMAISDNAQGPVGNIVEANSAVRDSLDAALLRAQRILAYLGARMVTSIEYGKRLGLRNRQRLLYSLMPKLPWAMGGFTEAQQRFVGSHYPEDFARACRKQLWKAEEN